MLDTLRLFVEPPQLYAILAALAVLIALLVVLARYLNRRYVLLRRSAGTDQIAFELARIANALEAMAERQPRRKAAPLMPGYRSGIEMSMFGR
jgi:hypothetical protein